MDSPRSRKTAGHPRSSPPAGGGRRFPWLVAAALLAVAAVTLFPTGNTGARTLDLCLFCGERGLADAVLNVFLFVPLGVALALQTRLPVRRVVLFAAACSGTVEVLQHFIPGRDPNPSDILSNTLGATLGFLLLRTAPGWLAPPPGRARGLLLAALAVPLLLLLAGGLLLAPRPSNDVYFGQWTAQLGHLEWYRGRVTGAWVGEVPVPSRKVEAETERLRALVREGAPVRISGVAGPPVPALAPIFGIYDDKQREILLVGTDREDAVLQYRTLGAALKLDRPNLRFPGAFAGIAPGDELRIRVVREGRGYCMEVNRARDCTLGYTVADTWGLLLFPSSLSSRARRLVGLAWLAVLFAPAGLWLRTRRGSLRAGALVAVGLTVVPLLAGLLPTPPWEVLAALAGMGLGALARTGAARIVAASRRRGPLRPLHSPGDGLVRVG